MEVRSIKKSEIELFVKLNDNPNRFKETVKSLWERDLSKPKWCFIIEEQDEIIGRVGYWTPDNESGAVIFGLLLPWESSNLLKTGKNLLKKSMSAMKGYGIKQIDSQIASSEGKKYGLSKILYEQVGLKVIQSKKSYILKTDDYEKQDQNRLEYTSLESVGKDFFLDLIVEVTNNTLDNEDQLNIDDLGAKEAAEQHFQSLKAIDYSPKDWLIGKLDKDVVGLVIPQILFEDVGTINYIGVIPDKRGSNYVKDLLAQGVENLIKRDISKIIADIDVENYPMENALKTMGFKEENKLLNYRKRLG
jgi:RimJ/RimL family protein N-acetyltransferase